MDGHSQMVGRTVAWSEVNNVLTANDGCSLMSLLVVSQPDNQPSLTGHLVILQFSMEHQPRIQRKLDHFKNYECKKTQALSKAVSRYWQLHRIIPKRMDRKPSYYCYRVPSNMVGLGVIISTVYMIVEPQMFIDINCFNRSLLRVNMRWDIWQQSLLGNNRGSLVENQVWDITLQNTTKMTLWSIFSWSHLYVPLSLTRENLTSKNTKPQISWKWLKF